jgi:hypothetical protein
MDRIAAPSMSSRPKDDWTCTSILLAVRSQSASDPKDKIFAFQGLLELLKVYLPAPDYSKSVSQIYREAAAVAIVHDNSLMLLSFLTGESTVPGLPLWVLDWSTKDFITEVASWRQECATGLCPAEFDISVDHRLITLRGTIIEDIEDVSPEYPQYSLLRSLADEHPERTA